MRDRAILAVLFDLDGVLVDACDWHYEALNKALIEYNISPINYDTHLKEYNGLPTKVKLIKMGVNPSLIANICDKKQEYTFNVIEEKAKVDETKIKLLSKLNDAQIKVACVTNSIRDTAKFMLSKTGIYHNIDMLVSNEAVEKNKPMPDCYNFAMTKFNIHPFNCICVEDSNNGYTAAVRSGIQHIWRVKNAKEVTLKNFVEWGEKDVNPMFFQMLEAKDPPRWSI